ncbi:TPM domain-containing protein [Paenibacillus sp. sgz500958]|uniref:TPM domain-containing protein n=1 Tax=Paenibacillus sp. sgz500958 TaxID=3242475 RepID=UPI0036D34051
MFILLWVPAAYAATIPAQQGLVTDQAGLLSSGEASTIAEAATGSRYTFHLLTIDSLEGTDSAEYATDAYNSWGLKTRDLLLLISSQDRRVELNFNNPGLQASLDAWSIARGGSAGSPAITALLDTYFIPYAGSGDFAGGITSLMEAVYNLAGSPAGAGNTGAGGGVTGSTGTGSAGTGTSGTGKAGDGGAGTSGNTGSGSSGTGTGNTGSETSGTGSGGHTETGASDAGGSGGESGSSVNNTTGRSGLPLPILALIVLGSALAVWALYISVLGMRRRKEWYGQRELLGTLLVRTNRAIESLKPFQGIVQGKTEEMVDGISKRLSDTLIQISALRDEDNSVSIPFYRPAVLKAAVGKLRVTTDTFSKTIGEEEKQVAIISEADRNVKERINELKSDAPELNQQLQSIIQETGFKLDEIAGDLQELADETAKADQLELFDPIAAQEITGEALEKQEQIEQDLKDVDHYEDKMNDFPEDLASVRSKIAGLINEHSLQNMKVAPYDNLKKAEAAAAALEAPLRSGDMDEVRKIASQLDILLEEAVSMTERQALLRQSNRRDLETVRANWTQLKQQRDGLEIRLQESRLRFTEQYVSDSDKELSTWSAKLREGAAELPQIENWTSDERGEYEQAHQSLEYLLGLQEDAGRKFSEINSALDALEERLTAVSRLFSDSEGRVEAAEHLLYSRGLSGRISFQLTSLPEYGQLEHELASPPLHLEELEALARSLESQIDFFVNEAGRLVRQKEEEERQAQLARMREQQRREQARKRMSSGPPSSGGFGGGRSSGGSSWGGSRSSGGSSWGGGGRSGGNSSGGSKW